MLVDLIPECMIYDFLQIHLMSILMPYRRGLIALVVVLPWQLATSTNERTQRTLG